MSLHKSAERVSLVPHAAKLLQSMRDIGYSFETAVADLIDNSISANATHIWIDAHWNNGDKYVAISDDGVAMGRAALIEAMRLGSADPTARRNRKDLGRFGLGLKTASLSQCRCFTVACKSKEGVFSVTWDVDVVKNLVPPHDWDVQVVDCEKSCSNSKLKSLIDKRLTGKHGTIVLWEKIDRPNEETMLKVGAEAVFTECLASLSEHLDLTFHRYLVPFGKEARRYIIINEKQLTGFDPFNEGCISCKKPQGEIVRVCGEKVVITPYVLPHPSKVSAEEYRKYEGKDGYLENAGFYIYRNRRLISKGTWFRLVRRSNLTKLLRIKVDVPTSLDSLWGVDVRKSRAEVPVDIRNVLKRFIESWENSARVVYEHRGHKLLNKLISPVWNRIANNNTITYSLNRENVFLEALMASLGPGQKRQLSNYLDAVDGCFPYGSVICDMDKSSYVVRQKEIEANKVAEMLKEYLRLSGATLTESEVLRVSLFHDYPEVVHEVMKKEGGSGT